MNQDQITAAVSRAQEVVNGFKTVRDQQARDVVALAGELARRDHQIETLKKAVLAMKLKGAGVGTGFGKKGPLEELFGDLFKGL